MDIQKEIKNIKNQLRIIIKNMTKDKQLINCDVESGKDNTLKVQKTANSANELSQENEGCIMDVAEIASENDGAIMDLAEYIANLESRIETLEGGS